MNERPAAAGQVAVSNEHLCRLEGNCLSAAIEHRQVHREPGTPAVRPLTETGGSGQPRVPTGGLHSFSTPTPDTAVESRAAAPPPGLPAPPGVPDLRRAPAPEPVTATSEGRASGATSGPKLQPSVPPDGPGPPRLPGTSPALAEPHQSQRALRAREKLPESPSPDPRLNLRAPQRPAA